MFQKLNLKDLYFGNIAKVTKNQEIILVKENIIFIKIKDVYGNIYYQTFPGQKETKKINNITGNDKYRDKNWVRPYPPEQYFVIKKSLKPVFPRFNEEMPMYKVKAKIKALKR